MQMSFDFVSTARPAKPTQSEDGSNDYHRVPASAKQLAFAQKIARDLHSPVPSEALVDRQTLSSWIDRNKGKAARPPSRFSNYPSSKQVAYAERIARMKRRSVPDECFRDKTLMSRWIDSNR